MPEKKAPKRRSHLDQRIQDGLLLAQAEIPELADTDVDYYDWLDKLMAPEAQALVTAGGKIRINPNTIKDNAAGWAGTLVHEGTHIKQRNSRGGFLSELWDRAFGSNGRLPYGQRPDEMEAFQAENDWRRKNRQPVEFQPSFDSPGKYFLPEDVNLPLERKKK